MRPLVLLTLSTLACGQGVPWPALHEGPERMRVWDFGHPAAESFAIAVLVGTGARLEDRTRTGLAHLVEHCLLGSTRSRRGTALEQDAHARGVTWNGATHHDYTVYWHEGPRAQATWMIELMGERMTRPRLDPDEVASEVGIVLDELGRDAADVRGTPLASLLYPNDPLGRESGVGGDPAHLRACDVDDVRDFFREHYRARNMIVAIRGGGDRAPLLTAVRRAFTDVRGGGSSRPPVSVPRTFSGDRFVASGETQGYLLLGFHVRERDPRALVALWVVGEALSHTVFQKVRVERRLAYAPSAKPSVLLDAWRLDLWLQASSRSPIAEVRDVYLDAVGELESLSGEAFESARQNVIRNVRRERVQDAVLRAWYLATCGATAPDPVKELLALRVEDVRELAGREFRSGHRYLITNQASLIVDDGISLFVPILGTLVAALFILDALFGFRMIRRAAALPRGVLQRGARQVARRRARRRDRRQRREAVDTLEREIQGWYERKEQAP